jgi:hypothetical protein
MILIFLFSNMSSKQIALFVLWTASYLIPTTYATSWDDGTAVNYTTFQSIRRPYDDAFIGPKGLYTTTTTGALVYLDATRGGDFSTDYPAEYEKFIDIAVKLGSKGVDFLTGEKASRSTDNICGQVCATAATSGSGVAIVCNVCTCSFYSSECIAPGECISEYVCQ